MYAAMVFVLGASLHATFHPEEVTKQKAKKTGE